MDSGSSNPNIGSQGDNIVVQLPGVKNFAEVLKTLGNTDQLFFRPVLCAAPAYSAATKSTTTTTTTPKSKSKSTSTTTSSSTTTTTVPPKKKTTGYVAPPACGSAYGSQLPPT